MDNKVGRTAKLRSHEEAVRFLRNLGLRVGEPVVRKVVCTLRGETGLSKYALYAHGQSKDGSHRRPICGKGTVYNIGKLYQGGKLLLYLDYLDAEQKRAGEPKAQDEGTESGSSGEEKNKQRDKAGESNKRTRKRETLSENPHVDPSKFAANFPETHPVRTLRLVVSLMDNILTAFFEEDVILKSEPLNTVYVRLVHRATELAEPCPEVKEALSDYLSYFPNLYESLEDPLVPEARWEYCQGVILQLEARVSELYATVVPIDEEPPGAPGALKAALEERVLEGDKVFGGVLKAAAADATLIRNAEEVLSKYRTATRQYQQLWFKSNSTERRDVSSEQTQEGDPESKS